MLAEPTPSRCTWHHCVPFSPEPKWSVNPPNVSDDPDIFFGAGCFPNLIEKYIPRADES